MAKNQAYLKRKAARRKAKKIHLRKTSPTVHPSKRISPPMASPQTVHWFRRVNQEAKDRLEKEQRELENQLIIHPAREKRLRLVDRWLLICDRNIEEASRMLHYLKVAHSRRRMAAMISRLKAMNKMASVFDPLPTQTL